MKVSYLVVILCGWLAFGCTKKSGEGELAASGATTAPSKVKSGPRTIEINASDNMKFSVNRIEATPGEEITVALHNLGSMTKDQMAHNFVLLKAGSDPTQYAGTAVLAKATDYMPPALADQVLVHTKLLGGKQSDEITFKVPTVPGEYPYLCSFPAHFGSGMKGVLVVK